MGKLFEEATKRANLFQAWRQIRENGYGSSHEETRDAIKQFDAHADRNLGRLQSSLRTGKFEFSPQIGVTKKKASGNGKRGIVMASVQNRIVERAILDVLQAKVDFVKSVVEMPTSVGGVPERSVPHGLKLIRDAFSDGYIHFARSDISGFFDSIPRRLVLDRIGAHFDDTHFKDILDRATTVVLQNEKTLGDDRSIFPIDDQGVAQGSPLSPLFGNILLYDFDVQFNKDGVICVRFIDDFVVLSKDAWRVKKAFQSAKSHLQNLGLRCHDPYDGGNKEKSEFGPVDQGFVFLGYDIRPGLYQPSAKAKKTIQKSISDRIKIGKREIVRIKREPHTDNTQRYSQTLVGIDRALRGWGNAFAYGNASLEDLDKAIDDELGKFRSWYAELVKGLDWKARRRTGGVALLSDIKPKDLADVPFRLEKGGRFVQSSRTITVSTDGSVVGSRRRGKDRGPGGWAFVVHETSEEHSGSSADTTNNQMELQAAIEALRSIPTDKSVCIRTDSQYVYSVGQGKNVAKSNSDMWREFEELKRGRRIKIVWVKGHNGDTHNERADALANQRASEQAQSNKLIK